jgi:hypothetical protein
MRFAVGALALLALAATVPGRDVILVLPRPLQADETAWIEVRVGPIGPGREIDVATATGRTLGAISPFGLRPGRDAGTYAVPVPREAIGDGRVAIRLTVTGAGGPARAPTTQEVRGVAVTIAEAPR